MASDESTTASDYEREWKRARTVLDASAEQSIESRHLHDVVIFLLPCSGMSSLRRRLLLPGILQNGGSVTSDGRAATHCVMAIPFNSDHATELLNKYRVSETCKLVQDSFLFK